MKQHSAARWRLSPVLYTLPQIGHLSEQVEKSSLVRWFLKHAKQPLMSVVCIQAAAFFLLLYKSLLETVLAAAADPLLFLPLLLLFFWFKLFLFAFCCMALAGDTNDTCGFLSFPLPLALALEMTFLLFRPKL